MSGLPVLFTERLILRAPEARDLDGFAEMGADAESMRFLGGTAGRSASWRMLCSLRGAWDIRGFSMFSVLDQASGAWVGRVGPWEPADWPAKEIGWGVHPRFAGRGYAHEATVAAMDYAFGVLGWDEVIHVIDPENARSIRLAERLGSAPRGPTRLPEPYHDAVVAMWGQSATQWYARRENGAQPRPSGA